jgi:REP element-mobilizing transposase RayT
MIRKYEYRRNLPHYQKDDRAVFATFNTNRRWVLPDRAREIALECCSYPNGRTIELHAAVVMPEHVHLVFTPLRDVDTASFSVAEILQNIKSVSAHRINKLLGRTGRVWQEESFDYVARCEDDLTEKIDYVCRNPIRRGLCSSVDGYQWVWVQARDLVER